MAYEFMWVDAPAGKLRLVAKGDALAARWWEADESAQCQWIKRTDVRLKLKRASQPTRLTAIEVLRIFRRFRRQCIFMNLQL